MKIIWLFLLLCSDPAALLTSGGKSSNSQCEEDVSGDALYLWSVQKSEESVPSWLFGTIHAPYVVVNIPSQLFKIIDLVQEAYFETDNLNKTTCDDLIINHEEEEYDISSEQDTFEDNKVIVDSPYLRRVSRDIDRIEKIIKGIKEEALLMEDLLDHLEHLFDDIPSWFRSEKLTKDATIALQAVLKLLSENGPSAIDSEVLQTISSKFILTYSYPKFDDYLIDYVTERGLKVGALETTTEQCQLLRNNPRKDPSLKEVLDILRTYRGKTTPMNQKLNDYNCLKMDEEPLKTDPWLSQEELKWFNEEVLIKRNIKMAERIHELLSTSDSPKLFVLGAAHLLGKVSVAEFLKEKKYIVKRLKVGEDELSWKLMKRVEL